MTIRTLVFSPHYRCEPEHIDALFRLDLSTGPTDILITRDNPYRHAKADVLHNYRKGRQAFLDSKADVLFVVESDIIPPVDALTKLAAVEADVVLGYYLLRKSFGATPNLTTGYNAIYHGLDEGKVIPAQGEGLGCVLIWRHVLASFDFRDGGSNFCDMAFHEDVRKWQFSTMGHLGVVCGHKRPDGKILWPDKEYGMRVSGGVQSPWHMEAAKEKPDYV